MNTVSIIIPTFNRQCLLQKTIDSIFRQTFSNWELIVIDDGSTDDTHVSLGERYGTSIRYVYQENQGESAARNRGIALAKCKYVAFLDSDDLWLPNKLERQVAFLNTNQDVDMVSTQAYWINADGLLLKRVPQGHDRKSDVISWQELVLGNVVAGGGSSALLRRECLERVGGFDEGIRFGEEWDLWLRLACHFQIRQIPEPLVYYRQHRSGTRTWAPRAHEADTMYHEHRAILENAFHDCPDSATRIKKLYAQAISLIYLRQAIVDSVMENFASASEHWSTTLQLNQEYVSDTTTVSQKIIQFATGYAKVIKMGDQLEELTLVLDRILNNLPSELLSLKTTRNALWSRCLAETASHAAVNKNCDLARRAAYRCLTADKLWRRNRGLWKILLTGGRHLWPQPIQW